MDEKQRRTIDNKWTNQNPVGFCFNKKHKGYLTVNMLKKHECLRKQCKHLKRLPNEYWDKREEIRKMKLERKLIASKGSGD